MQHLAYPSFSWSINLPVLVSSILVTSFILATKASSSEVPYEVWASDQSNTAPNQTSLGILGGYLWIYDSEDIQAQLKGPREAQPLSCTPFESIGPCNMLDVFPRDLEEYDANGTPTGITLEESTGFGRLHGALIDPSGRYANMNLFTRSGGYVGIVDTITKEAIGLFRVTEFNYATGTEGTNIVTDRSVHMSFWSEDGSALLVDNLHGKAIERINVKRTASGKIVGLQFDRSATLGLGRDMSVKQGATVFLGRNAFGNHLIGEIVGGYDLADLDDLTPNGVCKENGCMAGKGDGDSGGRPNNLPICPIPSINDNLYITLAGGGLLVARPTSTPMRIVGEYGMNVVYGAGCGGVLSGNTMFLNAGVSASSAGADQSMFAVFSFDDTAFDSTEGKVVNNPQNTPWPYVVFEDEGNTLSGGNMMGDKVADTTGQVPGKTTRRDSHGAAVTSSSDGNEKIHVVDRIQNMVETYDTNTFERSTFDLTSIDGMSGFDDGMTAGPCLIKSVTDDPDLTLNDPTPDLIDATPDGKYLMIAFRGPAPVSVPHAAQGSCPGVGIVQLTADRNSGRLVDVLTSTNTVNRENEDSFIISDGTFVGGTSYSGSERSDVHGVAVVARPTCNNNEVFLYLWNANDDNLIGPLDNEIDLCVVGDVALNIEAVACNLPRTVKFRLTGNNKKTIFKRKEGEEPFMLGGDRGNPFDVFALDALRIPGDYKLVIDPSPGPKVVANISVGYFSCKKP